MEGGETMLSEWVEGVGKILNEWAEGGVKILNVVVGWNEQPLGE